MGTIAAGRRKRVLIWVFEISPDLIDELSNAGIDVAAIGHGRFPGIESFSIHDLFFGSPAISRLDLVAAPSEWLDAEWFRLYSRTVQRIGFVPSNIRTDTFSGGILPGYDVEDMARVHLSHAMAVLKGWSIDEVWFAHPPHLGVDNMLSLAAQKMGIRVIEFRQVPSIGKFKVRVDDGGNNVRWEQVPMKPWTRGAFEPNLFYMKKPKRRALWRSLVRGVRESLVRLTTGGWSAFAGTLHDWSARFERRNAISRLLERLDPRLSPWVRLRNVLHHRFKVNNAGLERIADLEAVGDFVYFPLHLEPELNVHVLGRKFANQLDAIQAMAEVLPSGWNLLLKENPKQGYMHRGDAFYQRLRMLHGVRFVPDDTPSGRLIEQCRLVATIIGTAGYEAMLMGKSCIHFGDAWYEGLPGAYRFEQGIDVEAIARFRPDKADLDKGMNDLLSGLPDGLAYPRYACIYAPEDLPAVYRETARVMASISAAVG